MRSYEYPMEYDAPCIWEIGHSAPRARKEYKCVLCGQPILLGERHTKVVYVDEDRKFHSDRHHIFCPWEADHP